MPELELRNILKLLKKQPDLLKKQCFPIHRHPKIFSPPFSLPFSLFLLHLPFYFNSFFFFTFHSSTIEAQY